MIGSDALEPEPAALEPESALPSLLRRLLASRGLRLILGVAAAAWLLLRVLEALGGPEGIQTRFGWGAALLILPIQVIVSVSPIPGELVAALNVAIYGLWHGAALCWLGWMGAAFLEYGLARRTTRDLVGADPERLPAWLRRLPASHPAFLIFARCLPFGSHLVNTTAGAHGVALRRFTWTSALALIPLSVLFSFLAHGVLALP